MLKGKIKNYNAEDYKIIKKKLLDRNFKIIEIDGAFINNEKDIFDIFSKKLKFPKYFGNNWDALRDMLEDLRWINVDKITVLINNFDSLIKKSFFGIFLEILIESTNYWILDKKEFTSIFFVSKNNLKIISLINKKEKDFEIILKKNPDLFGYPFKNADKKLIKWI